MSRPLTTRRYPGRPRRRRRCASTAVAVPSAASANGPDHAAAVTPLSQQRVHGARPVAAHRPPGRAAAARLRHPADRLQHGPPAQPARRLRHRSADLADVRPRASTPAAVAAATTVTRSARGTRPRSRSTGSSTTPPRNTVYAHPVDQLAPDTTYELRLHGARQPASPTPTTTFTTESATGAAAAHPRPARLRPGLRARRHRSRCTRPAHRRRRAGRRHHAQLHRRHRHARRPAHRAGADHLGHRRRPLRVRVVPRAELAQRRHRDPDDADPLLRPARCAARPGCRSC